MARWKRRLLVEFGFVPPKRLPFTPLPPGSPDSAVATWQAIHELREIRALTDEPDEPLPLSGPFLARWSGIDQDEIRRGKYSAREAEVHHRSR